MIKRIGWNFIIGIIAVVIILIINKLLGNPDCVLQSIIYGVGVFNGMFIGWLN